MYLKEFGKTYVLWIVCAFTRMIKGIVLNDKNAISVNKGLHEGWCLNFGVPSVAFMLILVESLKTTRWKSL